jgi:hypothetical protein
MIRYFSNLIALIAKRRKLNTINEFLFVLRDQEQSARVSIKHYEEKKRQLEAEIFGLEEPDEIVRRCGI